MLLTADTTSSSLEKGNKGEGGRDRVSSAVVMASNSPPIEAEYKGLQFVHLSHIHFPVWGERKSDTSHSAHSVSLPPLPHYNTNFSPPMYLSVFSWSSCSVRPVIASLMPSG